MSNHPALNRSRKPRVRGAEYPDQKIDRPTEGGGRGDRGAGFGRPRRRAIEAHAFNVEPRLARHRLHHRRRHFRAHRSCRSHQRRSCHCALLRIWRHCLRVCGSLLRGNGVHRPNRGERLHLCLCDHGRIHRLDDRLGPDPRICAWRDDSRHRLVGLCRELSARPGHPDLGPICNLAACL